MAKTGSALRRGMTWIVVADSSKADIYARAQRFSDLEAVKSFEEPDARAREQDLVSDGPGRSFDSGGRGRHAMEPDHTEKQNLRIKFARRIADELDTARQRNRYKHLILVAAPAMLGELRAQLSAATTKMVCEEVAKDMTDATPAAIAGLIDEHA